MNVALIGAGIAGEITAHQLLKRGAGVTLYDPTPLEMKTSSHSMGVVALFGATRGLIPRAFPSALSFYEEFNHVSVTPSPLHFFSSDGKEKRIEERGFLMDAPEFMKEIQRRNDSFNLCTRIKKYITSPQEVGKADAILYAPGSTRRFLCLDGIQSKTRQGSFLIWKGHIDSPTFHYDFQGRGVVSYRATQKKLFLGTAKEGEQTGLGQVGGAYDLYQTMKPWAPFSLPPFEDASLASGVRELPRDRQARLEKTGENFYSLVGLYKNGFTLAPFFAQEFIHKIGVAKEKPLTEYST